MMTPLHFRPILKRIRWGGRRLGSLLGKELGEGNDYAESWEISCHDDDLSIVADGPFAGRTLAELIAEKPESILGIHAELGRFPLLIKFLDAQDRLSLQVHPNDKQAPKYKVGGNGKTEAWVILNAEAESRLFVGLKPDVTAERLRESIHSGTVEDCLHSFLVHAGDAVFIPAGTVHAIDAGILLAEIQQSSDLTFRLFDWGRLGSDGQPRPLHIDAAISCTDFTRGPVNPITPFVEAESPNRRERLVECDDFVLNRHAVDVSFSLPGDDRFRVLMVLSGAGEILCDGETSLLCGGQTVLVPADCSDALICPVGDDNLILLETHLP